jgi:hypothetical protein
VMPPQARHVAPQPGLRGSADSNFDTAEERFTCGEEIGRLTAQMFCQRCFKSIDRVQPLLLQQVPELGEILVPRHQIAPFRRNTLIAQHLKRPE